MVVYIVLGQCEGVYQDKIGEAFTAHPYKEIVRGFFEEKDAQDYIKNAKLKKTKYNSYGDTENYKGGYLDMEYESVYIE